ncbi:hypothetical protein EDI_330970 [Entamoeba dispar SAW760]|uniref:Uncharacterized protein n=1 Tax=Entamoeba dispar (strain ATCC PRA-260 / SAW760) TaxID=370354 RepID=B0EUC4_ENTDS|nr:uncharacterized protein EDI_330970 [Entamoeba dispar SAW760]EDR21875.1 hypothetical protein EDI_330970 [Entamoeba dispar SAW760]|eukprot:EDR21875.1 hypothetical protein EDI_330970 [Entamoeba dispar SAW760]
MLVLSINYHLISPNQQYDIHFFLSTNFLFNYNWVRYCKKDRVWYLISYSICKFTVLDRMVFEFIIDIDLNLKERIQCLVYSFQKSLYLVLILYWLMLYLHIFTR